MQQTIPITVCSSHQGLFRAATRRFLDRMVSPLCGLDQRIGATLRSARGARFVCAAADLTGEHVLRDQPKPRQGFYHLGGGGLFFEEAIIRALGETCERYGQFVSGTKAAPSYRWATYGEMLASDDRVVDLRGFGMYSEQQYALKGFPFKPFSDRDHLTWVRATSLVTGQPTWVPAQLILVGYTVKAALGEPWLNAAVTTGGAAHVRPELTLRNGLLELLQIDAAMGHWYSPSTAPRIRLDGRTRSLQAIIQRQFDKTSPPPRFFWLASPDLVGMTVACALDGGNENALPSVAVGLGSDTRLEEAMYKAMVEAVGVCHLAKVTLLNSKIEAGHLPEIDPHSIFDLDSNVGYYALPGNGRLIADKFLDNDVVFASDLPPDIQEQPGADLPRLLGPIRKTGKDLLCVDLTTPDVRALGFQVMRVWSPDMLTLCMPSAPPIAHRRFRAYGGSCYVAPHPYP